MQVWKVVMCVDLELALEISEAKLNISFYLFNSNFINTFTW